MPGGLCSRLPVQSDMLHGMRAHDINWEPFYLLTFMVNFRDISQSQRGMQILTNSWTGRPWTFIEECVDLLHLQRQHLNLVLSHSTSMMTQNGKTSDHIDLQYAIIEQ